MNLITYITSISDIDNLFKRRVDSAILTHKELSRFSTIDTDSFNQLTAHAKKLGLKVFLDWDVLATENQFESKTKVFRDLENIDEVRVQDPGYLEYLLENTSFPIQLILETGNHNSVGIKAWISYVGERLSRVILSSELSSEKLAILKKEITCPIEILGWGRILLFYTPRKLVSIDDRFEYVNEYIELSGESQESPHKGFPIIENKHGTFMFHIKELFIFDRENELKQAQVDHLRVDLKHRSLSDFLVLQDCLEKQSSRLDFKKRYAPDSIRGYFVINKSNVLFKKLKNSKIQRKDDGFVGEVIDASKDKYTAIMVGDQKQLKIGSKIKFMNPDGKSKVITVNALKNTKGEDITQGAGLVLTDYIGGIWVKSQVYQE